LKKADSSGEDRMNSKSQKDTAAALLKVIPAKWAIAIIAALIVYVLLQPKFNQWFGWNLPSVADLTSEKPAIGSSETGKNTKAKKKDSEEKKTSGKEADKQGDKGSKEDAGNRDAEIQRSPGESGKPSAGANEPKLADSKSKSVSNKDFPSVEDYLKEVGKNRFVSPAGLLYNPGSEEGHRLKHIERHLKDIPNRPGSHGVFEGSMVEFLTAIDDTVTRAKRKLKGTSIKEDDGEVVLVASFDKPIGFLGGQDGKRKKNPKIKKMKVVLRNDAVITAFPF